MPPSHSHSATLLLLMEQVKAVGDHSDQPIPLRSKTEYDVIPWHWQFKCHGAVFQLKHKHWSEGTQSGTATFQVQLKPE